MEAVTVENALALLSEALRRTLVEKDSELSKLRNENQQMFTSLNSLERENVRLKNHLAKLQRDERQKRYGG